MEIVKNTDFMFYSDLGVCFGTYEWLHYGLRKDMGPKLAMNSVSFLHAMTSVILGVNYLYTNDQWIWRLIRLISTGYFMHDSRLLICSNNYGTVNLAYLFHHIVSIYYLRKDPTIYKGNEIIFWGELSNLPSYLVYYLIKKKQKESNELKLRALSKSIKFSKRLQFALYSMIRIPYFGYLTYKTITEAEDKKPIFVVLPVYLMGVIWTAKLWKGLK